VPNFREWAVQYARAGVPVFPLAPRDKMPLISFRKGGRGFRDATTNIGQIVGWWDSFPNANVGGTPLVRDGVYQAVVDIDVQNGGDSTWNDLLSKHPDLPDTLVARTGQGGQHFWFWVSERGRSKLGQGVDCKFGDTGYVVLPPSVHPITGRQYAWETVHPVAIAPEWLRQIIRQRPRPPRPLASTLLAGNALIRFVASSLEGERNSRLFWAACRAVEGGSFGRLEKALEDAALSAGLDVDEISRVFLSAERRAG
jgi:hypothetical protein